MNKFEEPGRRSKNKSALKVFWEFANLGPKEIILTGILCTITHHTWEYIEWGRPWLIILIGERIVNYQQEFH